MSVPTHISQYAQYKQDTNDVAAWLLTAHPDFKGPKGPGRLKGKARRAAREEAEAERATAIVASRHVKEVPRLVAIKLRRSIVRRRYQLRHYEHGGGDADSNASHAHFIGVLEDVEKVLRPILPKEFRSKAGQAAEEDDIDAVAAALVNRFEALTVEDVADETPDRHAAAGTSQAPPIVAVNCKIAEEEAITPSPIYALEMLLEDLFLVTHHVQESWQGYREGRMTLEAATLATEMAHHLFFDTEQELWVAGGVENCPDGWVNALYQICEVRQKAQGKGETQGDNSGFPHFLQDLIYILESLSAALYARQGKALSDLLRVPVPTYDWDSDNRRLLLQLLLDEALVQNQVFLATPKAHSLPDADLCGMYLCHAFRTGTPSLTALYLIMFYVKMRLTMGSESGKAWPELRDFMEATRPQMSQARQRYSYLENVDEALRKILYGHTYWLLQAEIVLDDDGADSPPTSARLNSRDCVPSHRRISWFRSNPWLCGRLLMIYKIIAYCDGLYWSNSAPAPLALCHLYHAAKREKLLPDGWLWPGLERLISRHPDMFCGQQRPKTWYSYSNSLARALGGVESERTDSRGGARRGARRNARRGIAGEMEDVDLAKRWEFPLLITTLREVQIRWLGRKHKWTADEITRVMRESRLCQKFVKSTIRHGAEPKLTMVDALRRLRKCVNAEIAVLNEDAWLQYHNSSIEICTRIWTEFPAVRKESERVGHTDEVVYMIVHTLLSTHDRDLVKKAARIMQSVVSGI
ncbi:uncharacterized protein BO72DRAFT_173785 [Aspergillus fijiensis CBS 313.89]|uniref:DUF6604 domain-containing protein n=1 Tax=Aspergillus fijiensis CBS 313.89 TaxID=1448319 RepID=A0A8G1VZR3_9EURO|nr:uncharacterized protein BO72DRAFT_173785 [Aspergillus fijiensis CBS 313.89]RAK75289.1 hypothetical protein BO72DRAFT_173785 [Aspergillus fijiensis CBS 313.89]